MENNAPESGGSFMEKLSTFIVDKRNLIYLIVVLLIMNVFLLIVGMFMEGIAAIVAVAIACWLDVDAITRVLLIGSVLLVMIVEILNSAIEAVVDRIGSDFHELSGRAKDMGSAAVLLAIIIALITWGTLLWSHYH